VSGQSKVLETATLESWSKVICRTTPVAQRYVRAGDGGHHASEEVEMPRRLPVLLAVAALAIAACAPGTTAPTGTTGPADRPFKWELVRAWTLPDTIFPGEAAEYIIRVLHKANLNSRVSLSARCEPAGLVLALDPPRIAETGRLATLRVSTTPETPIARFTIYVTAIEDGVPEDFFTESSKDLTVLAPAGEGPHATVIIEPAEVTLTDSIISPTTEAHLTPQNGFRGHVALAMTGLTDDLRINFLPASIEVGDSPLTRVLFEIEYVPQGTVSTPVMLVLTANAGGVERSASIRVNLPRISAPGQ
jgi:hypothetical protein